jgi:iron(III) transport system substrate-binding protein
MKKHLLFLSTLFFSLSAYANTLTIYAYATEDLIRPIFEQYTQQTGVKINYVIDKGPVLIERLKAEGENSPADILMVVDAGNLWLATQSDLLAPLKSKVIEKNIPAYLRDSQNRWIGISQRARTIFYNPEKVNAEELQSYEDLADSKWKKRVCLRTSNNVYNQSLVASFIESKGSKKTESILKGWITNLAAPVFSSDTLLLQAIDAGQCDIGIANTYYYGRLLANNPNFKAKIFWPDQKKQGVHINVRGAGVTTHSKNKELAQKFLEWSTEPLAQKLLAEMNFEFPIHKDAELHPIVSGFGKFKSDSMPLYKTGENQRAAVQLMDRVGYK